MKCEKTMDLIYDYAGEPMPLLVHLRIALHLFLCPDCVRGNELMELSRETLKNDFFPPAPDLEESIMSRIAEESAELETQAAETPIAPGELSTRGWVIAGIIILVSLSSVFFGSEFNQLASGRNLSFLLPVGITIGIVLTSYGAFFIGSHLKELSKRFRL
jgi:hypothetical protein